MRCVPTPPQCPLLSSLIAVCVLTFFFPLLWCTILYCNVSPVFFNELCMHCRGGTMSFFFWGTFVVVFFFENLEVKMGRKLSKMAPQRVQNGAVNYLKIMLEFFQNLFKILKKSLQNGVPEGSWAVGGPFREARRPRDWFLMDLGVLWGSILGPIWEVKLIRIVKKSILSDSKSLKTLNTLLDGFQHRFLIDFGAMLELF